MIKGQLYMYSHTCIHNVQGQYYVHSYVYTYTLYLYFIIVTDGTIYRDGTLLPSLLHGHFQFTKVSLILIVTCLKLQLQ